jgi:hypothetical protein
VAVVVLAVQVATVARLVWPVIGDKLARLEQAALTVLPVPPERTAHLVRAAIPEEWEIQICLLPPLVLPEVEQLEMEEEGQRRVLLAVVVVQAQRAARADRQSTASV